MSDDLIIVVPADPTLVPTTDAADRVVGALRQIVPGAEFITTEASAGVRFFDCGENFESVSCPECSASINLDWWHDRMGEDWGEGGFKLGHVHVPCCGARLTLNDLVYDWPQAFGRFRWQMLNPNIGALGPDAEAEIERAASVPIRIVRRHI